MKRTVIKDGEPEQTVVETSQEFSKDGVNVSADDKAIFDLTPFSNELLNAGFGDNKNGLAANISENVSAA